MHSNQSYLDQTFDGNVFNLAVKVLVLHKWLLYVKPE